MAWVKPPDAFLIVAQLYVLFVERSRPPAYDAHPSTY
jgi:hypothetical protein